MVWSVYKYFIENKERYDLVIIEMNSYTKKFIKSDAGFLIPRWLEMQLDFDKALKSMKKQGVLKSINRHSLTFEKKSTIKDLKFFYERMYKPYIVKRHKDAAVISDFRYYLNLLRRKGSQLFFVLHSLNFINNLNILKFKKINLLDILQFNIIKFKIN